MMKDYEFSKAEGRLMDYLAERKDYLLNNFQPEALEVFIEFVVVYVLEFHGKFTVMSPIFTAYGPILIAGNLVVLQFFINIFYHHWWAHGNVFLIAMTLFG